MSQPIRMVGGMSKPIRMVGGMSQPISDDYYSGCPKSQESERETIPYFDEKASLFYWDKPSWKICPHPPSTHEWLVVCPNQSAMIMHGRVPVTMSPCPVFTHQIESAILRISTNAQYQGRKQKFDLRGGGGARNLLCYNFNLTCITEMS